MTLNVSAYPPIVWRQSAGIIGRVSLRVTLAVELWIERHRQRRALRELTDHMLKDIGIGRGEAEREGRKPFWRY